MDGMAQQVAGGAAGSVAVEVVWARAVDVADGAGAARRDRLLGLLDDGERGRVADLRRPADRGRYLAAHALARLVCSARTGVPAAELRFTATCPRCGGPHGKPRLDLPADPHVDPATTSTPDPGGAGELELSLAHAGDVVLVAVGRSGPVGVDVEEVAGVAFPGFDDMALAPAERAALDGLPATDRDRVRAVWWVRKEAALKATGDGLAVVPPTGLVVSAPDEPPRVLTWPDEARTRTGPGPGTGAPPRHPLLADVRIGDPDLDRRHVAAVALLPQAPGPGDPATPAPFLVRVTDGTALLSEDP